MARRPLLSFLLKKLVGNGDLFLFLPGLFFLSLGALLRHRGVDKFPMPGPHNSGPTNGEPMLLFGLGGMFAGLAILKVILFRIGKLQQEKPKNRSRNNRRRLRRVSARLSGEWYRC